MSNNNSSTTVLSGVRMESSPRHASQTCVGVFDNVPMLARTCASTDRKPGGVTLAFVKTRILFGLDLCVRGGGGDRCGHRGLLRCGG